MKFAKLFRVHGRSADYNPEGVRNHVQNTTVYEITSNGQ